MAWISWLGGNHAGCWLLSSLHKVGHWYNFISLCVCYIHMCGHTYMHQYIFRKQISKLRTEIEIMCWLYVYIYSSKGLFRIDLTQYGSISRYHIKELKWHYCYKNEITSNLRSVFYLLILEKHNSKYCRKQKQSCFRKSPTIKMNNT